MVREFNIERAIFMSENKSFVVLKQIVYVQEVVVQAKRKQDAIIMVESGAGEEKNQYPDRVLNSINWLVKEL